VTAIALAFVASVAWGIGDFLGGVTSRRLATLTVLAVSEAAGLVLLGILAVGSGEGAPDGASITAAVGAGIAGLVGLGALYQGMAVGAIGVVAPVSTLSALIPLTYGLLGGERPGAVQLAGAAAILLGVALVSREPGPAGGRMATGVGLALVAAVGFGLYFVLIDVASEASAPWAVFVSRGVASAIAVAVALQRRALRPPTHFLPALVAIGCFDAGANALLAAALNRGYTSIVVVVASLYPVVTVLLAATLLRERIAPLRAAGICAALVGVACVSAG
jgi:drug/metabolite transporter (DMT)-like permease